MGRLSNDPGGPGAACQASEAGVSLKQPPNLGGDSCPLWVESGRSFSCGKAVRPSRQRPGGPTGWIMPPAFLPSASSMTDIISLPLANTTS